MTTVHHIRQDVYNAVQGLRKAATAEGALRVKPDRRPDDLRAAASYASECQALILTLFNRAVRKARKEAGS